MGLRLGPILGVYAFASAETYLYCALWVGFTLAMSAGYAKRRRLPARPAPPAGP